MEDKIVCRNCDTDYRGNFCPSCGQKQFHRNQFELGVSIRNVAAEMFDLESVLGGTLKSLVTSPGKLTVDFLNGKQKTYVGPVKLYLIIITLNFLIYSFLENYSLINIGFMARIGDAIPFLNQMMPIDIASGNRNADAYFHTLNQRINEILPFLLYFLIFAQALILKIQFYSSKRFYMEHLVFSLHFMAFGFLRDIAILPVQFISPEAGFAISIITTGVYLFFAIRKSYVKTPGQSLLHTLIHYSLFLCLFFLTVLLSILLALWSVRKISLPVEPLMSLANGVNEFFIFRT